MLDFDRKPTPKSAEERELDALCDEYYKKFGVSYVFGIGINGDTMQETLTDLRQRLKTGKPQPKPDYKKGLVY